MKFDFKKYGIDIVAVVSFIAISLLFCYPQLSGKKLFQHDNVSWQSMAHEAMTYYEKTGKDVMWSNSMFGGMPTFATYVGTTSTNYPGYVQVMLEGIGKPAYFFFIAMLSFYLLMCVLKVNKWVGIASSFAFAFASYNPIIIGVGHDTKMLTIAYLPAALAGIHLVLNGKRLTGAILTALMFSLIVSNNHFQVIFYSIVMFVGYFIAALYKAFHDKKLQDFFVGCAIIAGSMAIGGGTAYTSFATIKEYSADTMRGGASELSGHDKKENGGLDKEYAFRWSNSIGETFCLLIPYLYGGSSSEPADKAPKTLELVGGNAEELPLYWGSQPFIGGPVYFGAVVCFLFVLGLIVVKNENKWWIAVASLICIMMSWGKNFESFNYFMFDHIPMLNKFRTPSMWLVIPQFLFPLLGALGLQELLKEGADTKKLWKQVLIAMGITAGICVLAGVFGSAFFDFKGPGDARYQPQLVKALIEDRAALAMSSGLKSAIYILIAGGLMWAFLNKKIKKEILIAGIAILFMVDLLPVAHEYLNDSAYKDPSEYESVFEPRDVDKAIMKDPDPYYRVLDLSRDTYNDAVQAYFHKCIGGYHPAKMEIYQDLIDRHLGGRHGYNEQVLDMLNTKYFIIGGQKSAPRVMTNPNANGNAWFVDEVKWASTADEEMESMDAPGLGDTTSVPNAWNSRKTAVIRNTFKTDFGNYTFGKDSAASVKLAEYGLNDISFTSQNSKDGLAVFSDIYYNKGWKAYVDGNETPILKADYVLRCLKIPAGTHKIEFHFHPDSFYKAKTVSLVSSLLMVGLCIAGVVVGLRKKGTNSDAGDSETAEPKTVKNQSKK